jgi:hypothetical protein
MKFITKIGVACTTIAMMASTISYAGTVPTGALLDHYIGADGDSPETQDVFGGPDYDIEWMTVDNSVSGQLTVQVKTAFVSHNTSSYYDLGDLFIMDSSNYTKADECSSGSVEFGCNESSTTTTSNTKKSSNEWEYAFDLGWQRKTDGVGVAGELRDIANTGNTEFSSDVIDTYKDGGERGWQIIMSKNAPDSVGSGTWTSDVGNDILSMTFDISNTPLMGAAQLALRWQMTCANDIIEVVTNFGSGGTGTGNTQVPEPSTFMLMLLAGFGLFASRKKKDSKYKA